MVDKVQLDSEVGEDSAVATRLMAIQLSTARAEIDRVLKRLDKLLRLAAHYRVLTELSEMVHLSQVTLRASTWRQLTLALARADEMLILMERERNPPMGTINCADQVITPGRR